MPAVSQFVPDLIGGVSTQPDVKKFPNQVSEANNVMIDPSFGLCKRTGSNFLKRLGTADEFKNAYWFFYRRDEDEFYLVAVQQNSLRVFNSRTLNEATVTEENSAFSYLTSNNHFDYRSLTIQDNSIVVNRTIKTEMATPANFVAGLVGTIVIRTVEYGQSYTATIDGTVCTIRTRNSDDSSVTDLDFLNADQILSDLKAEIDANTSGYTVTQYPNSLEIVSDTVTPFTLFAQGGTTGEALIAYQDSVRDISWVADESYDDRTVKVENTTADNDDYYIKYNASINAWEETVKPGISTVIVPSTMPHELISTDVDQFTFRPIDWNRRQVGDLKTNPNPSFIGEKINGVFLTNNRLGFLSVSNVIMSVTSDYYNFFARSATTTVDSDPIDINCNSTIPTNLSYALAIPAGMVLYSDRQQFLLSADQTVYTPSTTYISQVSNYEVDKNIPAVDLGTYQAIITKTFNSSRIYFMQVVDINEPPIVAEISKVVTDYLPKTIDNITSSPENDMLVLTDRSSNSIYFFRRFNTGAQDAMQAWFKWTVPGKVLDLFIANDMMFAVTVQSDETTFFQLDLAQNQLHDTMYGPTAWSNVSMDFRTTPLSKVYDSTTDKTKCYVPFADVPDLKALCVDVKLSADDPGTSGYYTDALDKGTDGTGNYYEFKGDLTSTDVVVGLQFAMEVDFPELFFKEGEFTDYSAYLNISRMKFSVGLTGALGFKVKAKGRDEWYNIQPVIEADYYLADAAPLAKKYFFTVPIHQRSGNFVLRAYSDLPYPTCLNMMSWEGVYSPRFYRRT